MKKRECERQIGVRVGMPAFFVLELESVYRQADGAHRALAFPDFVGLLVGLGLEQYRGILGRTARRAGKGAPPQGYRFNCVIIRRGNLIT